jgi:hypothetical protein
MKKLLVLLMFVCAFVASYAQTATPQLGFTLPPHGAVDWDTPTNGNFSLLDQYLSGQKTLPNNFWNVGLLNRLAITWDQVSGKPALFPADWNQIVNLPSTFPPKLPTTTSPGGVFMPGACGTTAHVSGIDSSGQLICTPDLNSSFQLLVNGNLIATGLTALNFVGSSGLQISGDFNSGTGVLTLTVTGSTATQAQTPTFSPLPGTYSSTQSVTLACASPSPTIYYTTDGSTPTHGSTVYTTTISAGNTTIKTICASSGLADSNVVTGIYTLQAPAVTLQPTSLTFATQKVNTTSGAQVINVRNTGSGTLTVSSVTLTGTNASNYAQTNNCTTVTAGSYCSVTVTFTPSAAGTRTATVSVADNASGSPHTASLSGVGASAQVSVSPSSLSFGNQQQFTNSATQNVTITNTGSVYTVFASWSITSGSTNFSIAANTCPGGQPGLAPGNNCVIGVRFNPQSVGALTGTLTVTDDSTTSPHAVSLTGTGTSPPNPVASISPMTVSFGSLKLGTTSAGSTVTLTNTGNATLNITSIAVTGTNSGDFSQTNNCASTLTAGNSCQVTVRFSPTVAGSRAASLSFTDNASGSPQTVTLSGTGVAPTVTVSPSSINFGSVNLNTSSSPSTVTITNTSTVIVNVTSITISGDYSQTNNCGSSIGVGANCTANVTFTPTLTGTRTGTLTINDDATGNPHTVSLTGSGVQPVVSLSATNISFGSFCPGDGTDKVVTITNTGTGALSLTGYTFDVGTHFLISSKTCTSTLAAGNSCTVTIGGTASLPYGSVANDTMRVFDNAANSPQAVTMNIHTLTNTLCQ